MVSTMTSVEQVKIPEGYKQTEVGVIPEDWEISSGEEITNLIGKGASPRWQGFSYTDSGMLFVTSENVRDGFLDVRNPKYLPLEFHEKLQRSKLYKGDILINLVGASIGRSCQIKHELGEANINQAVAIFRVKDEFNSNFIACYFQSDICIDRIFGMQVDAARPNVSLGDLRGFLLPLPPPKEQTAIANALSDVDKLIASLETLIAKKSAIKTAAMQQLLTGKKRLPGFENKGVKESEKQGTKASENKAVTKNDQESEKQGSDQLAGSGSTSQATQSKASNISASLTISTGQTAPRPGYKQTELGEMPEDWEVKPMSDTAKFINGRAYGIHEWEAHGTPVIRLQNLTGRGENYYFSNLDLPEKQYCKNGDLLYMWSATFGPVIWFGEKAIYHYHIWKVEASSQTDKKFLYFTLDDMTEKLKRGSSSGGTMLHVTKEMMESTKILCPSLKEQTAIANVLSDMDTELEALQQRLNKTKTIKQGMMQELLTGKTRLV